MSSIRVTSASQAAARDAAAVAAGIPSRALMQRAGAAAATEIARLYGGLIANKQGVGILAGPGDNGGDAWVVARALAASGATVSVTQVGECSSMTARAERELAIPHVRQSGFEFRPLLIDGLLGTGASGEPRGEIANAVRNLNDARQRGAVVVALDVPSGVDSTTGKATLAATADLTLTFGTLKRGLLLARANAGRILVLDIGLGEFGDQDGAPTLVSESWVRARVPEIAANAYKGDRRKLVVVGGALGMAGAPVLAARAAMQSGIGMVRLLVARENVAVVQTLAPEALAGTWLAGGSADPRDALSLREMITEWADCVLLGPGLGVTHESRGVVDHLLRSWRGPVVLDADALNVFKGRAGELGSLLEGRPALLTPHVAELARLSGVDQARVLENRFEIGCEVARTTHAAVLVKGVPTVISAYNGEMVVSASGTPALAAAGSGDLLSGIAATLLAQTTDALVAGACAAWIHGRAAEIADGSRTVRGVTLADVERALPRAWSGRAPEPRYPVLMDLPAAGFAA